MRSMLDSGGSRASFFDLPLEIRDLIYSFCICTLKYPVSGFDGLFPLPDFVSLYLRIPWSARYEIHNAPLSALQAVSSRFRQEYKRVTKRNMQLVLELYGHDSHDAGLMRLSNLASELQIPFDLEQVQRLKVVFLPRLYDYRTSRWLEDPTRMCTSLSAGNITVTLTLNSAGGGCQRGPQANAFGPASRSELIRLPTLRTLAITA